MNSEREANFQQFVIAMRGELNDDDSITNHDMEVGSLSSLINEFKNQHHHIIELLEMSMVKVIENYDNIDYARAVISSSLAKLACYAQIIAADFNSRIK